MSKTAKRLGIYLLALLVFISVSVTLRTVACMTELDFKSGYFDGKICITIANWFAVGGCVAGISYLFVEKKGLKFAASQENAATYIPSGLVSVALLFLAASLTYEVVRQRGDFLSAATFSNFSNLFTFLLAAMAVVSVGAFLLRSLIPEKELPLRAGFDMVFVIFLALYTAALYFDSTAPLNSPAKITDEMAYLFAAVFFIYETRISLGRELWKPYIAFGIAAALLTAYSSVPSLILYFSKGITISDSIAESALTFTLFVFIICRLALILTLPEDKACPTVNAILLMEDKRAEAMAEASEALLARDIIINEENDAMEDIENDNYTIDIDQDSITMPADTVREDG